MPSSPFDGINLLALERFDREVFDLTRDELVQLYEGLGILETKTVEGTAAVEDELARRRVARHLTALDGGQQ